MAQDVSGTGSVITLSAIPTFPAGFQITDFPADTDPVDVSSIEIADKVMGVNGDLITWAKANPHPLAIAVIPGSPSDRNLQVLALANMVAPGKPSFNDQITVTVQYPDGSVALFNKGRLTTAMFGKSISSSGMIKTRVYGFTFESVVDL